MQPQFSGPSLVRVLLAPFASLGFLLVRPRLLAVALIPALLSLLILVAILTIGYQGVIVPVGDWAEEHWGGGVGALSVAIRATLFLWLLLMSGIISYLLIIPVSAPFCGFIVEEIEEELLADDPDLMPRREPWLRGVLHSLREAFRRLGIVLPIYIGLFALGFIPILGAPLAAVLWFFSSVLFLSANAYSSVLDRRKMTIHEKLSWMWERKRLWVPLGVTMVFLIAIPCNVFWLPVLSAVAAARFYCEQAVREKHLARRAGQIVSG